MRLNNGWNGLFNDCRFCFYFYIMGIILQVEFIFNFDQLVLEINYRCFDQFIIFQCAQVINHIDAVDLWDGIFNNLEFIFIMYMIVFKVELFRLSLNVSSLVLIATDYCYAILLDFFHYYYNLTCAC